MPLLKWTVIELFCDYEKCFTHNRFEGVETTLLDLIKLGGWKFYRNECYCSEHRKQYSKTEGAN